MSAIMVGHVEDHQVRVGALPFDPIDAERDLNISVVWHGSFMDVVRDGGELIGALGHVPV